MLTLKLTIEEVVKAWNPYTEGITIQKKLSVKDFLAITLKSTIKDKNPKTV